MKFTTKLLLICLSILAFTPLLKSDAPEIVPKYNQKEVFPDQFNSATNTTNLEYANFTSPPLSSSLSEQNPQRKMRFIDFIKALNFVAYRLTRGETEQMFLFADGDRDGLLDHGEWDTFVGLYVLPFEACDRNHDYLLDENEFGYCFQKDPKFKTTIFPRKYGEKVHLKIMEVINTRQAMLINFNEYLFIRRALFGWKSCQSNAKYIAKSHFSCALKTALSFERKMNFKLTDEQIYNAGVRLDNDSDVQLNFVTYLRILHYFNLFNVFSSGNSLATLDKQQLLKAIKEDRLPNNFEETEIENWYDLISSNPFKKADTMNFSSWVFFYSLHHLFNKYSIKRPHQLNQQELMKLMKDELAPGKTAAAIDASYSNFSEAEYQEASLTLNRLRPNEGKYYVSFLSLRENSNEIKEENRKSFLKEELKTETSTSENEEFNSMMSLNLRELMVESLTSGLSHKSKTRIMEKQDASENTAAIWHPETANITSTVPNLKARKVFFSIFKEGTSDYWTKASYYRAFALGNLFTFLIPDERSVVPSTVFIDKLMTSYELSSPPISSKQRENYSLYKILSRDVSVDILTFFAIENFRMKLKTYLNSSNTNIQETILRVLLNDFGMRNLPETVFDLGLVGSTISKERLYNPEKTMEFAIFVQSIASENARHKAFREKLNLKTNLDPSRRYPGFPRRAMATPYA